MQFQFESLADLFYMAGHGPYVWACYGVTLAAMVYLAIVPLRARKALFAELKQQQRIAEHAARQRV